MWRITVVLVMAFSSLLQAQQVPDMFSCVVPARLTPRTLEYRSGEFIDHWTIAPVTVGDRRLVRGIRRRMRDARTTAEHTVDLEPGSLAPVAFRIMSAVRGLTVDLVVHNGQLTGQLLQRQISEPTGGNPVLIGTSVDDVLVAAVDWERCTAVSATTFDLGRTQGVISYARVGERSLAISGREVSVFEILRQEEGYRSHLFVTKSPPFVVARIEYSYAPASNSELVALPE